MPTYKLWRHSILFVYLFCLQERNPTTAAGRAAAGSSLALTSSHATSGSTPDIGRSSVTCVNGPSPGLTTSHCTWRGTCKDSEVGRKWMGPDLWTTTTSSVMVRYWRMLSRHLDTGSNGNRNGFIWALNCDTARWGQDWLFCKSSFWCYWNITVVLY